MAIGFGEKTGLLLLGWLNRQCGQPGEECDVRDSRLSWCSADMAVGVEPLGTRRDMARLKRDVLEEDGCKSV
jgi:hypothetical protein